MFGPVATALSVFHRTGCRHSPVCHQGESKVIVNQYGLGLALPPKTESHVTQVHSMSTQLWGTDLVTHTGTMDDGRWMMDDDYRASMGSCRKQVRRTRTLTINNDCGARMLAGDETPVPPLAVQGVGIAHVHLHTRGRASTSIHSMTQSSRFNE